MDSPAFLFEMNKLLLLKKMLDKREDIYYYMIDRRVGQNKG